LEQRQGIIPQVCQVDQFQGPGPLDFGYKLAVFQYVNRACCVGLFHLSIPSTAPLLRLAMG
jgi:hypothetical protein